MSSPSDPFCWDTNLYFSHNLPPKTGPSDLLKSKLKPDRNGIQKMDLKRMEDPADWFRMDEKTPMLLALKKELFQKYPEEVRACLPCGRDGALELCLIMMDYLGRTFPQYFELGKNYFTNKITNHTYDLHELPHKAGIALVEIAAFLVSEDLILLHYDQDQDQYILSAGSLCFPSSWSLLEKLGRTIQQIHAPVPLVNENLGRSIDQFLKHLKPGQFFERVNFLTTTSALLPQLKNVKELHQYRNYIPLNDENVGEMYMRNEREILMKLPKTGDILFSLKTYITKFSELSPLSAHQLYFLLKELHPKTLAHYRHLSESDIKVALKFLKEKATPPSPN